MNQVRTGAVPPAVRVTLGLVAGGLVAGGGYWLFMEEEAMGGVFIRVGLLAGAAWWVAPLVRRPSLATVGLLVAGTAVLFRPRLIVVLAVAAVIWRISKRQK